VNELAPATGALTNRLHLDQPSGNNSNAGEPLALSCHFQKRDLPLDGNMKSKKLLPAPTTTARSPGLKHKPEGGGEELELPLPLPRQG